MAPLRPISGTCWRNDSLSDLALVSPTEAGEPAMAAWPLEMAFRAAVGSRGVVAGPSFLQGGYCLRQSGTAAMVIVTHVRLVAGGVGHEHISEVRWWNPATGDMNSSTRRTMVDWIRDNGLARVTDGYRLVDIRVVDADPPYIRTVADGVWTDNLLELPRF